MTPAADIDYSFVFQGMAIAILGPTFQDLAENVNKNVSQISYIFVGRSMGYFGGSLIGGILFDSMNAHLLLGKLTDMTIQFVSCCPDPARGTCRTAGFCGHDPSWIVNVCTNMCCVAATLVVCMNPGVYH